jgi:hypothetical protein
MVGLEQKRFELKSIPRYFLFFFAFVYPFVLENARMFEGVESYGLMHIIPLPKSVRIVEILFLVGMGIYVLFKTYPSSNYFFTWKELFAIVVSITTGIFIKLLNDDFHEVPISTSIQVVWVLLCPYLLFFIFYFFTFSERFFRISVLSFFVLGIINAIAGVYQFQFLNSIGDDVNGAMQDAHSFGNVMLLLVVGLFIIRKFRKYLLIILLPLVAFVGASSQKSYVVFVVLLLVYMIFFADVKTKLFFGIAVVVFGSFALNFVIQSDPQIVDRFLAIADFGMKNSGIGQSYANIIDIHNRYIFSYPFGIGIGNYANPINYPSFLGDVDVPVSALFREKITNYGVITAFDMQVTYVSFLLVEVGLVGFFFIASFYYKILKTLIQRYRSEVNDMALFTAFGILIPIISSFFTLLYSMEQISLMYPLMAMAGMLCQTVLRKDQGHTFL